MRVKLTLDPAFSTSIHVVPKSDLAPTKAVEARPLDTSERGPSTKTDHPKTWPILIATSGLRSELATDAKRFGAYVAQAVEANAAYFFPPTTNLSDQAIFAERSRAFFQEAIQLARDLYPLDAAGQSPERSLAYAAIDQQVHRLHEAIYGSKVYDATGGVAWTSMCHWPLSPVLVAQFEEMRPSYLHPEELDRIDWGHCGRLLDRDGDGTIGRPYQSAPLSRSHFQGLRDSYADDPEALKLLAGHQQTAEIHAGIGNAPDFVWNPGSPLKILDLCTGLDSLNAFPRDYDFKGSWGFRPSWGGDSSYFKKDNPRPLHARGSEEKE